MDLVGPRLDHGVHDGSVAAAEFCAVGVSFDLEFSNRVDRRLHDICGAVEHVAQVGIVVDAIEQEVILQRARAIGTEAIRRFDARSWLGRGNARAKQCQLCIVPSVQWKRIDALAVDDLAKF